MAASRSQMRASSPKPGLFELIALLALLGLAYKFVTSTSTSSAPRHHRRFRTPDHLRL